MGSQPQHQTIRGCHSLFCSCPEHCRMVDNMHTMENCPKHFPVSPGARTMLGGKSDLKDWWESSVLGVGSTYMFGAWK